MKHTFTPKEKTRSRVLHWMSIICFLAALSLVFLTYLMTLPGFRDGYAEFLNWLTRVEIYIAGFNKWIALFIILAIFLLKCFVPVLPLSALFITSGMVFPGPAATVINLFGFGIMASVKYYWGKKYGGGNAHKLLLRSDVIYRFMDFGGKGNKWMLVILRFIPFVPLGTVSRLYGTTLMPFFQYLLLSAVGYLPRLISWSIIGINITNPFSIGFMAPIIVLLLLSGASLLLLNTLLNIVKKDNFEGNVK